MIRVMIDALSQVGAGSRTYLHHVLPRLPGVDSRFEFTILWPTNLVLPKAVEEDPRMIIKRIRVPQKPALFRLLHQQLVIPFLAWKMDLFYAPVDIAPIFMFCPVVLAIRNPNPFYDISRSFRRAFYYAVKKTIIRVSAKRAEEVIFVSRHSRDHIQSQLNLPDQKTSVIYHGIDAKKFTPQEGKHFERSLPIKIKNKGYILCVSTVTPHKNMETLIHAYASLPIVLREKHTLVIAGRIASRAYYHQLLDQAARMRVADQVIFMGEYPHEIIQELYFGARIFVLPSFLETFGHPLVEAMAAGVPVIASNESAIPEILGGSGILFDPGSPEELTRHMHELLLDDKLINRLSTQGQIRAGSFSWDRTVRGLLEVFSSVISRDLVRIGK